jgi:hypothetical protein
MSIDLQHRFINKERMKEGKIQYSLIINYALLTQIAKIHTSVTVSPNEICSIKLRLKKKEKKEKKNVSKIFKKNY